MPRDFKICLPTLISSTGLPVNETRIVSPIPISNKAPIPAGFIVPVHVPASVIPNERDNPLFGHQFISTIVPNITCFSDITIFVNLNL